MNNELIGIISNEGELVGELDNKGLSIDVTIVGTGEQGKTGKSAYQEWLDLGNVGSEEDFILSLKGLSAYEVWLSEGNIGTVEDYLKSLKGSDAEVTNANVINAIGYTPVNKAGDVVDGNLDVNGRLIIQGGMTFQAYGQNIDFNAATLNNITSLSTRGATPSFIMGIDYNGYPATLNHGFVVNVKNATSGRGLASNKAYHVVDTQDPANPILKFGVSSVGVVEAETYKTLDGIEVSYEGHKHQVSDIEGLENVGSIIATLEDIKGATGSFQTSDGKTVTVVNGLITNIV